MVSGEGRILDIIKLIIEYDISIISDTTLRARTDIITEGPDSNLTTILKDRISNSELSNVLKDFKSMTVNNNNDRLVLQKQYLQFYRNNTSLQASNPSE